MPIRPENRALYPKDWPSIAARIRARDGNRCKFCGLDNGVSGWREPDGRFRAIECIHDLDLAVANGWKVIKIVLTVAHLVDMHPSACADENLAALCQKCHLNHDLAHHIETRRKTIMSRKASGDLFGGSA